ncbi:DMT family transporter [Ignatzschineria rhizosphaerae]|uniref:DMT family transporter n=1 Tax=Ignatzschineria rhizosphaerae TaxID=2923279 RepID=A0ABY3X3I3_9GAMM|nr:DMT family transporter [Ignatzschineria rhizosphaerae]UNM95587.1 DMT family transporter [Ignatzschineria rhizosphaerae]
MQIKKQLLSPTSAMILFVLLWGSAAIFTRWGLDNSSVFLLLLWRYGVAFGVLLLLAIRTKEWLPKKGTRLYVLSTGALLIGAYSICYFQAMKYGVTPGILATLLGVQPILTLFLSERHYPPLRIIGLLLAFMGLVLIVFKGIVPTKMSMLGVWYAIGALFCITIGTLMQKKIAQKPQRILPLQYAITIVICLLFLPTEEIYSTFTLGFWVPALWLGIVISVIAQLLLYHLIRTGNLVNITSLFYLVPIVTAILDYLILGNAMSLMAMLGMAAIIAGIMLVFKRR